MPVTVTAFTCQFCPRRRAFLQKSNAKRHERQCFFNPESKACVTCKHFSEEKEDGVWLRLCAIDKMPSADYLTAGSNVGQRDALTRDCEFWEERKA